jgi:hypothetical protein
MFKDSTFKVNYATEKLSFLFHKHFKFLVYWYGFQKVLIFHTDTLSLLRLIMILVNYYLYGSQNTADSAFYFFFSCKTSNML